MDFIVADKDRMEQGMLTESVDMDLTLYRDASNTSGKNDAKVKVPTDHEWIDYNAFIFCPGTEYGGRVLDLKRSTSSSTAEWYMDTWRRMLGQSIIEPPLGQAYRFVEGDANDVIRELLEGLYDGLFVVPETASGIAISGQFDRYITLLDGLNKILAEHDARLKIQAFQGKPGEGFYVQVEAVNIADYSEEIEYSQDNRVNITVRDYRRGINHLICLGRGELTERMVHHLYIQQDGSVGEERYFTGMDERTAVFDYPNAEDETELLKSGEERLLELTNYKKLEMSVQDMDIDIGDIVAGRDRESDLYLKKPIIAKILKIKKGSIAISYKVKGDD